eukprot:m.49839 g.49839  ORF g.49839 m.49839 type:complete len:399 (+) comp13369_c0_seq4:151-1347(+)
MAIPVMVLHSGCGNHTRSSIQQHRDHIRGALLQASGQSHLPSAGAMFLLSQALGCLEKEPTINAGCGGNLNVLGQAACDAGIMDLNLGYAAVGDTDATLTPSHVAYHMCTLLHEPKLLGRLRPRLLVGAGVRSYCEQHGLSTCDPSELVSAPATKRFKRAEAMMVEAMRQESDLKQQDEGETQSKRPHRLSKAEAPATVSATPCTKTSAAARARLAAARARSASATDDSEATRTDSGAVIDDTVGGICVSGTEMATGASSGGILFKNVGRIGPAAVAGAGFWACQKGNVRVSVCTSGTGELLMQHLVALRLAEWALECLELSQTTLLDVFKSRGIILDDSAVLGATLLRVGPTEDDGDCKHEMLALAFGGTLVYGWQDSQQAIQTHCISSGQVVCQQL